MKTNNALKSDFFNYLAYLPNMNQGIERLVAL